MYVHPQWVTNEVKLSPPPPPHLKKKNSYLEKALSPKRREGITIIFSGHRKTHPPASSEPKKNKRLASCCSPHSLRIHGHERQDGGGEDAHHSQPNG